ncbi:ABC transporter ATP-binding protein [Caproiciproducens sp. R1]|uniref:ABC transporter ATP-binding protein n=1 Tax=Caproiciproducens sp. R1 TaxID=3435000 RepID=UPI0040344EDF
MFKSIQRIIRWCGELKGRLYAGFAVSLFSTWFSAAPVMIAAYTIGLLIDEARGGPEFDENWVWLSLILIVVFVFLRFLFDYLRAKFQESISYELAARDRLAVGSILKRVSLGYFQKVSTGEILNAVTTGLNTLENMGIRMIDTMVGGYLNCLCIFLCLAVFNPLVSLIAVAGVALSFLFLLGISHYSVKNAPAAAAADRDMATSAVEYARGLSVVKSFGQGGAALASMKKACGDSKRVRLKIECGFIPNNCGHLLALRLASAALVLSSAYLGMSGQMPLSVMLMFCLFSFTIFGGVEPIADTAHILGVIDEAMDQLDRLKTEDYIDEAGKDIRLKSFDISFHDVSFGYDSRKVLEHVSFTIPQNTMTAIVGPSGGGKTTVCNLLARFYDVWSGSVMIGGRDVREFTCDSLLSNISMVFQNVYLFHDTIRKNICFGKPDATEEEMVEAAKAACCHEFISALPDGYDTIVGEGGSTLSGGEKQRVSIARVILKNAPVVILDEATASVDPENEHLIQQAISSLTRGKTIIVIAHRLATIENADQILVIDDGRVAQRGTHAELMAQDGIYRKFVSIRQSAEGWKIT